MKRIVHKLVIGILVISIALLAVYIANTTASLETKVSAAYEGSYSESYPNGKSEGYQIGYDEQFPLGYDERYQVGQDEGYTKGYDEGYTKGYDEGYQDGMDNGNTKGYDSGYSSGASDGRQKGYADGYSEGLDVGLDDGVIIGVDLRIPSYNEVRTFLRRDRTDRIRYDTDDFNCTDYSAAVVNNAAAEGIRAAFVIVSYADEDAARHTIIAFDTVDKGLVYFEPQSDEKVNLTLGKRFYQSIVVSSGYYYERPSFDDTVVEIQVIW